jgi:hypothetical protein
VEIDLRLDGAEGVTRQAEQESMPPAHLPLPVEAEVARVAETHESTPAQTQTRNLGRITVAVSRKRL